MDGRVASTGFPHPYVRLQRVVRGPSGWRATQRREIWLPVAALHHAHLATNANGEVGVSVARGGGKADHATGVTGFVGDSTLFATGESTTSTERWGDYTAIRPHWPNDKLFSVSDYYLLGYLIGPKPPIVGVHQYRLFGRTEDVGDTE